MKGVIKGRWNVVLSGYPRVGKTMLALRLVAENQYFARVGVDELRKMLFDKAYPCRDEFLVYSMIARMRDALLERGYSVVIDSTAPNNVTRRFLLTTKITPVNRLLIMLYANRKILIRRNVDKFGDSNLVFAWDKRWEKPEGDIPIFKFKSDNIQEFEDYYARLRELLESEMHPFKSEFHPTLSPLKEIGKALENFLKKHFKQRSEKQSVA